MNPNGAIIVGIGEFLWDVLPDRRRPGGAPTNFAWHVSQMGGLGVVVSAVGNDSAGVELKTWLEGKGLSSELVQTNAHPTSTVSVELRDGQPSYVIHEGVAWDFIEWTPALAALAGRADCVCVGSLAQRSPTSRSTIQRFLGETRRGCLRIFDINLRQTYYDRDVIEHTLAASDVLKLNDEEWPIVAAMFGVNAELPRGLAELLVRYDLRLIALTRGSKGSMLVTQPEIHEIQGQSIDIVNTIGAGDSFTATLALGLLRGGPLAQLHDQAANVAGFVCTQPGAMPELPDHLKTPSATSK